MPLRHRCLYLDCRPHPPPSPSHVSGDEPSVPRSPALSLRLSILLSLSRSPSLSLSLVLWCFSLSSLVQTTKEISFHLLFSFNALAFFNISIPFIFVHAFLCTLNVSEWGRIHFIRALKKIIWLKCLWTYCWKQNNEQRDLSSVASSLGPVMCSSPGFMSVCLTPTLPPHPHTPTLPSVWLDWPSSPKSRSSPLTIRFPFIPPPVECGMPLHARTLSFCHSIPSSLSHSLSLPSSLSHILSLPLSPALSTSHVILFIFACYYYYYSSTLIREINPNNTR